MAKESAPKIKPLTKHPLSAEAPTPTPQEPATVCFVCGANSITVDGDENGLAYTEDELLPVCSRCLFLCAWCCESGSEETN